MHKVGFLAAIFALIVLIVILTFLYGHRIFARLRRDMAGKTKDR